jgi:hypothetical protein
MKGKKTGTIGMKSLSFILYLIMLSLTGGIAGADDNEAVVALAKKIVAEDKTQFGIDAKQCRLECQRVYSEAHGISQCDQISHELRDEGFERERLAAKQAEEEKPLKYKEAAEKYR